MKTKIVAIGGGHVGEVMKNKQYAKETTSIDKEIIALSGKKHPILLFIPTASHDSEGYSKLIRKNFEKLGCKVDILNIVKERDKKQYSKILNSDIIYVGGGNTLFMMNLWRKKGIDKLLLQAYKKGIVLSGLSAGAICWFKSGNSDSRKFKNRNAKLIKVSGLGYIDALCCPHYDTEKDRKPELKKMMKNTSGVAIAIDECCAIEIIDDTYRIITSKSKASAYKVYWKKGKYYHESIKKEKELKPLGGLLQK
jgi:dipeptidase E